MSEFAFPELPTDIGISYPDRSSADRTHQAHHDAIHQGLRDFNTWRTTLLTSTGYYVVLSETAPAETQIDGVPVVWIDLTDPLAEVPVNPPAPTWDDATSRFTVPSGVVGVDYVWTSGGGGTGATVTQGATIDTSGAFPRSVVITPAAKPGYVLASAVVFSHDFLDPADVTVIGSDGFSGAVDADISGRSADNALGGTAGVWSTHAAAPWGVDGSGQLVSNNPLAGWVGNSLTFPVTANVRVEFDVVSFSGSQPAGAGVGLGVVIVDSDGLEEVGLWMTSEQVQMLGPGVASPSGDTLTPGVGHWLVQLYGGTMRVVDPSGNERFSTFAGDMPDWTGVEGRNVGLSIGQNGTDFQVTLDNLTITKLGF